MRKNLTVALLRRMLDTGELTPREAVMLCRDVEEDLFSQPLHERALAKAAYASERIAEKSARATTGVPIAVEDTLCIAGVRNLFGVAEYDATIVRKLDGYGALIVGALQGAPMGVMSCMPSAAHTLRAAVASRLCAAALGSGVLFSQIGGQGADGLVALKPSFGTVSRYGLAVAAPSLKQIGIVATDARDAAIMMDAISDFDPFDPAMRRPNCYDYGQDIGKGAAGMTIGVMPGAAEVSLEKYGCIAVKGSMPEYIRATYDAIECVEALLTLSTAKNMPGERMLRPLTDKGRQALEGGFYDRALAARTAIAKELTDALRDCDALLMPMRDENLELSAMAAELSGLPCVSRGGVVLMGRMYDEVTLLRLIDEIKT